MTPPPSALTVRATTSSSPASVWKGFRLETGCFLLHVPSSHLLEVDPEVLSHIDGVSDNPEIESQLSAMVDSFPPAEPRRVATDIGSVSLNMAQGCNLRCTYCFAGEGDYGVKGMMSFETARSVLEFFTRERKQFQVVFFGGEPMLNFDVIKQVVAWCETQPCKFSFSMTTNGTLLNEEKLQWLKDKRFAINWSYDGQGLQDRQRLLKDKKTGSSALVERKLAAFQASLAQLRDFRLRTTVTRENLDALEESILSSLNSKNFKLHIARHAAQSTQLAFTDTDIAALGAILTRVVDHLLSERSYDKLLRLTTLNQQIRAIHRGETGKFACGAGVHYLTVSVQGKFYLCHRFNEDESENFGDVQRGLDREKLAAISAARKAKHEPCASCWMREWCSGGCFHEHKIATGDKFQIDPTFCKLQALEMQQAVRIYTHLLKYAPEFLER